MVLSILMASVALVVQPSMPDPPAPGSPELLTTAERSGYRATSTHAEALAQLDAIAARFPLARRLRMGTTHEGREIPVLVIADPPVGSAEQARLAALQGRPTVLLFGNIHAGECDAKEALGILARQLAEGDPIIRSLVVSIAPIYNADGNERVGPPATRRPGQDGPELGCGVRENAQGLDLNRDFVKVAAPETRALIDFMNRWDPLVIADGHTTNGSNHRYLMTYAGPKSPAGDPSLVSLSRDRFMPEVARRFHDRTGHHSFWYGNFEGAFGDADRGQTRWETFPAEARFGTTYIGLRGRLSVLTESYSYAPYRDRVLGQLAFFRAILESAAAQREDLIRIAREADKRAVRLGADAADEVAIRSKAQPRPGGATILGFVEETRGGRSVSTGVPRDVRVELWDLFVPEQTVRRPRGYAILHDPGGVIDALRVHGIAVHQTTAETTADAETFRIRSAKPASRPFQGWIPLTIEAETSPDSITLPAGTWIVSTAQPLSNLVVYLLEPESEDGLATWNFFDGALSPELGTDSGKPYPVVRLLGEPPQPR
jgi:hypothetical protein